MEYIGIYDVRRQMHSRPFTSLVTTLADIRKTYQPLYAEIRDLDDGEDNYFIRCDSVMGLLTNRIGARVGSKVEIKITGKYSIETLKECANRLGGVFSATANMQPMDTILKPRREKSLGEETI